MNRAEGYSPRPLEAYRQLLQEAAVRVRDHAHRTPVLRSHTLDRLVGGEIFFKCENFQRIGAFKFRGAFNAISQLSEAQKGRGVLTYSSGNHAQAVALVSRLLGIEATIVMPANAPLIKRQATEGYGARVIPYDPDEHSREQIAQELLEQHGYTFIPPFDHEAVMLGQGTCAMELIEEAGPLDMLLVTVGGGGLIGGCALAMKSFNPNCQVIGIEPALADDATRSFYTRTLQTVHNPPTIADGTRTPSLGKVTFPIVLNYVDAMHTVSEGAIYQAVQFLFYRSKLVVEPSGALGVAALLEGIVKPRGRVGIILCGGNIDGTTMAQILNETAHP